jgi:hypothetical protein
VRAAALIPALAGLLATGCGSGDQTNLDDFIGVWAGTGIANTKCGAGAGTNAELNETITITKGVAAPLLVVVGACSLQMDVQGNVATLRPNQTCTLMRNGLSVNATYSSGHYTVMGIKATFQLAASFTVGEGALVLACSYLADGNATKMQK